MSHLEMLLITKDSQTVIDSLIEKQLESGESINLRKELLFHYFKNSLIGKEYFVTHDVDRHVDWHRLQSSSRRLPLVDDDVAAVCLSDKVIQYFKEKIETGKKILDELTSDGDDGQSPMYKYTKAILEENEGLVETLTRTDEVLLIVD